MNLRTILTSVLLLLPCVFAAEAASLPAASRKTTVLSRLTQSVTLGASEDLHLTDSAALAADATVTLTSPDGWLFFDHVKPNDVVARYAGQILINGKAFDPETNGRIAIYRQGAVVMAQNRDYAALTATADNRTESFVCNDYYSNQPPACAPDSLCRPLRVDNAITHIRLARGYMATLACEPNGMGYSRVFVADTADLDVDLPRELSGKVSFVRVVRWQYASKKGWAGSTWSSMPDGLKYVFQQADLTNSTWYYNWGSRPTRDPAQPDQTTYNQEFVPEKWGAGGSWEGVYSATDSPHLLGYNEPDHTEQSNVTVDKAIEEWPLMMQTGLRLGSPATTNFSWLYNFMKQCRQRNYRVDYVVVHAYWGGLSASEWYTKLKDIHDRTGRPIWIKEWNNGANWTKEGWPSKQADQYARQLRDISAIVSMLDTCSFVERYSIYNWVEDKRMMIDKTGHLTPAGEWYAADEAPYFFDHQREIIPQWRYLDAPVMSYDSIDAGRQMHVHWTDNNGEQTARYVVCLNGAELSGQTPVTAESDDRHAATLPLPDLSGADPQLPLTVTAIPDDSTQSPLTSNTVTLSLAEEPTDSITLGETLVEQEWQPMLLRRSYASRPVVILGTPTYRNKMPLSPLTRGTRRGSFDFGLRAWMYQENPTFYAPDTLSYLLLPAGRYHWQGVEAEAGSAPVDSLWQLVSFSEPFASVPVVIASASLLGDTTATAAIRNVTPTGFEACLRYEGKLQSALRHGEINYLAATTGQGTVAGRTLVVGRTADGDVDSGLTEACEVRYGADFSAIPAFFSTMQTAHDTLTATLRQQSRGLSSTQLIKDREKSAGHELVSGEQVGFIAIGSVVPTAIASVATDATSSTTSWYTLTGIRLPGQPTSPGVYLCKKNNKIRKIEIGEKRGGELER
jgi:hypothetical protein